MSVAAILVFSGSVGPSDAQVRMRNDAEVGGRLAELREQVLGQDVEVFQLNCTNDHFRREVTLFANGTLRVREGYLDSPEMWLGELDRATTAALIEQLQIPDLTEVRESSRTAVGEWVETCVYVIDLPGEARRQFDFRRLDSLDLELQKALNVAVTALGMVDRSLPSNTRSRLPSRYVPKRGDILVAADGREFRVNGFINNNSAVELIGVDQPLVRFVVIADLAREFVELKSP